MFIRLPFLVRFAVSLDDSNAGISTFAAGFFQVFACLVKESAHASAVVEQPTPRRRLGGLITLHPETGRQSNS